LKLLDPGVGKFIARWLARGNSQTSPRTTRLFFGADMTVVLPEVISEAIYTYGMFDPTVTWMALRSVRAGDTVFDVGAHFGYFALLFAHLAGPRGRGDCVRAHTFDICDSRNKCAAQRPHRAGQQQRQVMSPRKSRLPTSGSSTARGTRSLPNHACPAF
jgi:hypothetical protein